MPVQEERAAIKTKVGDLLVPSNKGAWDEVGMRLNRLLRGWSAYFRYRDCLGIRSRRSTVYDRVLHFVRHRLRLMVGRLCRN